MLSPHAVKTRYYVLKYDLRSHLVLLAMYINVSLNQKLYINWQQVNIKYVETHKWNHMFSILLHLIIISRICIENIINMLLLFFWKLLHTIFEEIISIILRHRAEFSNTNHTRFFSNMVITTYKHQKLLIP